MLFMLFMIHSGVFGQITLEQTYNHSGTITELSDGEYKYFMMDAPLEECRIYNMDHTIYKTINLPVPDGFFLYDLKFVSRHLFNEDENIEVLYIYYKVDLINSQSVNTYGMKVMSENGTELLNLADAAHAEIQCPGDEPKLLTWRYIWYDYYYLIYTNVYALGGGETKSLSITPTTNTNVYPNPAADYLMVQIPSEQALAGGDLLFSDIQGRRVLSIPFGPGVEKMNIPTGTLDPGSYILNITSAGGTVLTEKIEKK